jgi:hypothetical protein
MLRARVSMSIGYGRNCPGPNTRNTVTSPAL